MGILSGWTRVVIGVAALALAACAGPPPPPPTVVELTMVPAANLNSAAGGGTGVSVQVFVYQLTSPDDFTRKDYSMIGELSGDLLAPYTLIPGEPETVVHEFGPEARYLGIIAKFFDINNATWKATVPIPPNETTAVTANVGASTVALQ